MSLRFKSRLFFTLIIGATAGIYASEYGPAVDSVLAASGDNRGRLEQVLKHYSQRDDSLKLEAARFLIGNMREHSYVTYYMHDTAKAEVPFDVLSFPNYDSLQKAADSIEAVRGPLDFSRHEPVYDMNVITPEFLIEQIDYAFMAWRDKPWARTMSWEDFCSYVLPYRGSNEPLEPWRQTFWDKYRGLESRMTDPTDPVEAARLINQDIMTWFGFDARYYYHPTDQGLSEMLKNHLGRCEDMTNITIYSMRANGIGITSDYTPYWANCGNNHAWNAVVTADGRVIPFMGAEANPGEYKLANKVAKVYRKTFSEQEENLAFQENKQDSVPRWLAGKYYRDVTKDYVKVCDVTIAFDRPVPDSVSMAYLCVFNSGEWQPIHWGRIQDGKATFKTMGGDIAYLPALYLNQKVVPYGAPFLLSEDCSQTALVPTADQPRSLNLVSTSKRQMVASTEGVAQSFLTNGQEYELFYWKDGWQSLAKKIASDQPLVYENVPSGALYWLVGKDSDREERIFTIDSTGTQIWW